jgi:hypothetical protein
LIGLPLKVLGNEKEGGGGGGVKNVANDRNWPQTAAIRFVCLIILLSSLILFISVSAPVTKYVHIKSTTVYAPRRNWDSPPTPFSPASVPLPPETGGRGHTSLRVGGWGESQFRRGAYTVVLFICTYFVAPVKQND